MAHFYSSMTFLDEMKRHADSTARLAVLLSQSCGGLILFFFAMEETA